MSEPSFPFEGTQVADGPAGDLQEARGNRRTILILGVVGTLVLGALAYFFVFSGGEEPTEEAAPVRRATDVQATPAPVATPVPAKAPKLSKKSIGKDPFKALIVPPVAGVGAGAPAGGTTTTGGSTVTGGTTTTGTAVTGGTTTSSGGGTSTTPLTVKVVSVAGDNSSARVTVGTKAYSVAVGDVFGTYFKALRLKNGKCGAFTYGDERFDLCEGETAKMQ